MDRAGAALGDAAAIFGANQTQMVAQHPQKRSLGVDIVCDHPILAIDAYVHGITACFRTGANFDSPDFGVQGKRGQKRLISLSFRREMSFAFRKGEGSANVDIAGVQVNLARRALEPHICLYENTNSSRPRDLMQASIGLG
jgi:hypothetical protein